MTTLFHGSTQIVNHPLILPSSHTLDYGAGFYTTTSEEQAERWVRRKLTADAPIGYINCYETDIEQLRADLDVLWFERPDEAWLDFVMANRTDRRFVHTHDVVFGPVANDRVYTAFALYESGVLDKPELIRELRTYKLIDQLLFHTDRALRYLRFTDAKEICL